MGKQQQIVKQLISLLAVIIPGYSDEFWSEDTILFGNLAEFDSMAIVTLIAEIEEQFDIALDDDDITAENFESIARVAQLVLSQQN